MSVTKVTQDVLATVPANLAIATPTITDPVLSGSATGTYTLAGTPTITTPTITTPTITGGVASADPTAELGLSTKQYADRTGQPNPIINGSMEVWQPGTTFVNPSNIGTADMWVLDSSTTGQVTVNRSTNVPTFAAAGVLFNYSLEVDVTTADAAVGAGDFVIVEHVIEGFNWRLFAQRQLILSFWAMSTKTGIHSVAVRNNGADRSYVGEYTISVADTWEYKTISVTASPSAGAWNYVEGRGLIIAFTLMVGSTNGTSTIGSWINTIALGSNNQVNVMDNVANFFRLTGVKLGLGTVATPIQAVSFQEELEKCKRYYKKSFNYATAPVQNAGVGTGEFRWSATIAGAVASLSPRVQFDTTMRTGAPVVTLFNPAAGNAQVRNTTDGADHSASGTETNSVSDTGFNIVSTGLAGTAVGESLAAHWVADARL